MAHKLADELLKEILAPPLRVRDALFNDVSRVSPFSKAQQSASDVLLVCKRWMRVGTPALYESVVIRSKAQAAALSTALTRNAEFGRFTRKLRLEGTYAQYLNSTVISTMPNIVELCIPIGMMAADKPNDLQALLERTAPHIQKLLLVNYRGSRQNSTRTKLIEKIATTVGKSKSLNSLSCMYSDWEVLELPLAHRLFEIPSFENLFILATSDLPEPGAFSRILSADRSTPTLTIFFPFGQSYQTSFLKGSWISHYGKDCSTLPVSFVWPGGSFSFAPATPTMPIAELAAPNSFWHPMQAVGRELRVSIWHRIVSFAIRKLPEDDDRLGFVSSSAWVFGKEVDRETMKFTAKVSRELADATVRAVASNLHLTYSKAVRGFSSRFNTDATLRSLVKSVYIDLRRVSQSDALSFFARITYLERLEVSNWPSSTVALGAAQMSWASQIGLSVGYSLRFLAVERYKYIIFGHPPSGLQHSQPDTPLDPIAIFGQLTALEELIWGVETVTFTVGITTQMQGLARLRLFHVIRGHKTFLDFLASASLPSLVNVSFDPQMKLEPAVNFFARHGPSIINFVAPNDLTQGVLDHLTHIEQLSLSAEPTESFFMKKRLPSVKKVKLSWPMYDRRDISRYSGASKNIAKHGARNFPNLAEICVASNTIWPTTERDEKKNQWLPINDILMEVGVLLKDSDGRTWRKRLTVTSSARKK